MPKSEVIRAPAYLGLCGGVVAALLAVSIGAFLDPSVNSADPGWMFWAWTLALAVPLLRAPFVGVAVHDDHLVRRTRLRSVTLPRSEIIGVEAINCSGLWNWGNASPIFRMASLQLGNGSSMDVPELSGRSSTVVEHARRLRIAIGLNSDAANEVPEAGT